MRHLIEAHLRRDFLRRSLTGIGTLALADLMNAASSTPAATDPLLPRPTHYKPKAKRVIFLFQEGAPSQMDLFDPKPALQKWHGKPLPPSMTKDLKLAFIKPTASVLASPRARSAAAPAECARPRDSRAVFPRRKASEGPPWSTRR